ncbi:MAG TPA: LysR family transcriptional regulator [Natronosporangium sp.]
MELRQLEQFVAVAEERHFTRAARRLRIVQSGLSASVRALERDLGVTLFTRSTRRVELTEAGRVLLVEARRVLAAAANARDAVAAVQGLLRGRLRVGIMQSMRELRLPEVLADFHAAHPGVEIELSQAGSAVLAARVRDAQLDLAFVALSRPVDGLSLTPLVHVPMVLACAVGHRLADRAGVRLAELDGESFVDFPADWGGRMLLDDTFAAAGLHRRVRFEVGDVSTLLDVVAQRLGVAIVPENLPRPANVRYLPLRGIRLMFTVSAAVADPGTVPPAARELLERVIARQRARAAR